MDDIALGDHAHQWTTLFMRGFIHCMYDCGYSWEIKTVYLVPIVP